MNPFSVDQTYVASLRAIRDILTEISGKGRGSWEVEYTTGRTVRIMFVPDEKHPYNYVTFEFPVIGWLPFPDGDGIIVCLYPPIRKLITSGFAVCEGQIVLDDVRDFETFWEPIYEALKTRYSDGPASGMNTISSSSSPESLNLT